MAFLCGLLLQLTTPQAEAGPLENLPSASADYSGARRTARSRNSTRRSPRARRTTRSTAQRRTTARRTVRQPARPPVRRAPVRRPPPRRVVRRPPPPPPRRAVRVQRRGPRFNRENTVALGVTGGSWLSGNPDAGTFLDGGLGAWFRVRPRGPVGLQVDASHFFGVTRKPLLQQARQQTHVSASTMWFVLPQSPVTPYVLGGVGYTHQAVQDQTFGNDFPERDNLFGLQAGGGLEIALGRSAVLDIEARYLGYLNRDANDPLGTVTTTVGIGTHF